jgi:ParB-like chromosome segregation protein Spo0J
MNKTIDTRNLIPYARNYNTHPQSQIQRLAGLIDHYGFTSPLVVADGNISAGHGRLLACQLLWDADKDVYPAPGKLRGAKPLERYHLPVVDATGWSNAQLRAYLIADNELSKQSEPDFELLKLELSELKTLDIDLEFIGLDDATLDLLDGIGNEAEHESDCGGNGDTKEIDPDDYQLGHRCPRCGFEFDDDK